MVRTGLAALTVFVVWMVLEFVLHGVLLSSSYALTPQLWRPMAEFKTGLNVFVVLLDAICFVLIYAQWINPKTLKAAVLYGVVFGIARGASMGYGSYAVMPLPYIVALAWFLAGIVECGVAGYVTGLIVKPSV